MAVTRKKKSYSKRKSEDYIFKRKLKFAWSRAVKVLSVIIFIAIIALSVWMYKYNGYTKTSEFIYDKSTKLFIRMGLKIKSVEIEGNKKVPTEVISNKIIESLGDINEKSILLLNLHKLNDDLTSIGWIENIDIKKKLPDTIIIHINERMPKYIWQNNGEVWLADEKGDLLTQKIEKEYIYLPIIVGQNAPTDIPEFINIINSSTDLAKLVVGGNKIGGRRWNINLKNNIKVELPEDNAAIAWKKLAELDKKNNLLSKNIDYIDLRIENQLVTGLYNDVKPGPKSKK